MENALSRLCKEFGSLSKTRELAQIGKALKEDLRGWENEPMQAMLQAKKEVIIAQEKTILAQEAAIAAKNETILAQAQIIEAKNEVVELLKKCLHNQKNG